MTDYSKRVKCPHPNSINTGLSACKQSTMLTIFGKPGKLSKDCSPVTNEKLKREIVRVDVGPFEVSVLRKFGAILADLFKEVKAKDPELYSQVGTAGGLCCRAVRGSLTQWSNHSWAGAIDLKFGGVLDTVGDGMVQLGLLAIYPYAYERRLFWGAEFGKNNPKREDGMHFELSDELVRELYG